MVGARFEGDIGRRSPRLVAGFSQGMDFGVRFAGEPMPAFADDLAVPDDDAAYTWIG